MVRWTMKKYKKLYSDNPLQYIISHVFRHTFCANMVNAGGMDTKDMIKIFSILPSEYNKKAPNSKVRCPFVFQIV